MPSPFVDALKALKMCEGQLNEKLSIEETNARVQLIGLCEQLTEDYDGLVADLDFAARIEAGMAIDKA